jgi:hypothetical protein
MVEGRHPRQNLRGLATASFYLLPNAYKMNKCEYKSCKETALSLSEYCWQHINDKDAYRKILADYIKTTASVKGFYLRHLQFPNAQWQNINAEEADLAGSDLSNASLTAANLKKANLTGADLSKADLSGVDLEEAHLLKCNLSRATLWHALIKDSNLAEADLEGADFLNATVSNVKLWHVKLQDAKFLTRHNFIGKTPIDEKGPLAASEAYRILKQYFINHGRYDDASWASFKEKQMERRYLLYSKRVSYLPSLLMAVLCGYGEKPYRVIASSFSIIVGYSLLYRWFDILSLPEEYNRALVVWDYLYFSIVTFTTVGFGDLTTKLKPLFQMLVGSEAFIGAFMMGLFVFTLSRRYSAR